MNISTKQNAEHTKKSRALTHAANREASGIRKKWSIGERCYLVCHINGAARGVVVTFFGTLVALESGEEEVEEEEMDTASDGKTGGGCGVLNPAH